MAEEAKNNTKLDDVIDWYRKEGINFFPLQYKDKRPVSLWKEYQTRRITDDEIDIFFKKSEHNIGVVCGSISDNLFVLDFDTEDIFNKYFSSKIGLVYVKTGRGFHVYFKAETVVKPLKCFDDEGREILTLKSEGGYVVAPPSIHPSGAEYVFKNGGVIPILNGDVREEVKRQARKCGLNFGNAEGSEEIDMAVLLQGVPRGGQDNAIMHIAHYLRRQGASFEEAFVILQTWNKLCNPPIPVAELHEKAHNHYRLPEPYSFFYKTNPAKISVTPDLKLLRSAHEESVKATELMDIDDNGKTTIDRDKTSDYVESNYNFICINGTHELFYYQNGVYLNALGELDRILQRLFSADATIHFKLEMNKQIIDRNSVEAEEINADNRFLPVHNGLLNLETMSLEPFTPEKFFTSGLDIVYDPQITAPLFEKTIKEILPGEDRLTMQELFGFCLWRGYPATKSFWLIGDGGNGKTMLMNVLTSLLSHKNVSHVSLSELDGQHRFAVYELFGKFANIIPEPETTHKMQSALFKAATGEDELVGEIKGRQKRFNFSSFAKQIIYANSLPEIADSKKGMWDRVLLINFPMCFRGTKNENVDLAKELSHPESLTGILNWALEGLSRLRKNNWRFTSTAMQQAQKTKMRIQSNPIEAFSDAWIVKDRHAEVVKQAVYDAFDLFSAINGITIKQTGAIARALVNDPGIEQHRMRIDGIRRYVFKGCKLSDSVVVCYGRMDGRPLHPGELEEIEDHSKVEVCTCTLGEYLLQYIEPAEEVEQLVDNDVVIFNSEDLIPLHKTQKEQGTIRHVNPQVIDSKPSKKADSSPGSALFIHKLSPIDQGLCERCGKFCFLISEMTDEEGKKSLICGVCTRELEAEIGIKQPAVFGTTLEQRRESLKESEAKKEKSKG